MFIGGGAAAAEIRHRGEIEPIVFAHPGDTVLLPAGLDSAGVIGPHECTFLVVTLSEAK